MDKDRGLYRIEWQDLKDGKYCETLVNSDVKNFYVDRSIGLATVSKNGILSLASGTEIDLLKIVESKVIWNILTCIAKCWIVSGELELDGQAIMASISKQGDVRSTFKLKLTSNGYKNSKGIKFAGIYSIHDAFVRGRRGIMLAIERDGCCHLISVMYGSMSKLQSIASIVLTDLIDNKSQSIVMSVTATDTKGEFIAGGFYWTKKITIKLK